MAETIKIEIFRNKNADEFTAALADPDSRLETGSGAAATAAVAAAFLCRAAGLTARTAEENERVAYIARNAEILRKYMVHLIDEDVHSRGPLRRAMNEGGAQEIEAARQPAVSIAREIVNMMGQLIDLAGELAAFCPQEGMHLLAACAELALASMRASRHYIVDMSDKSTDETYRYINRRENEMLLGAASASAEKLLAAAEKQL